MQTIWPPSKSIFFSFDPIENEDVMPQTNSMRNWMKKKSTAPTMTANMLKKLPRNLTNPITNKNLRLDNNPHGIQILNSLKYIVSLINH